MTVARSKKRRLPWSCLAPRGTFRVVASRRLARTRQRLRAKAGRVFMKSRKTDFSTVKSSACSGARTLALRGDPVSSASSPSTSPGPRYATGTGSAPSLKLARTSRAPLFTM